MTPPHLLVAISGHGFGHAGQTLPVLQALRQRRPDVWLTLSTAVPRWFLESRLDPPFEVVTGGREAGMVMNSPSVVDREASADLYARMLGDWEANVAEETAFLDRLRPDGVLANVPVLPLAAAARRGLPCAAMCSLNWAAVYNAYCAHRPEAGDVHARLRDTYAAADAFLRVTPGLAMDDLPNRRCVGPIGRVGQARPIRRRLGLDPDTRVGLVTFGGIGGERPLAEWPRRDGWVWGVQAEAAPDRPDVVDLGSLGETFTDLVASVDVLVTKTGYGTFVEATLAGTPVVYEQRPAWPEGPPLAAWLAAHNRRLAVDADTMRAGTFVDALPALLDQAAPPPPTPHGIDEAACELEKLIG